MTTDLRKIVYPPLVWLQHQRGQWGKEQTAAQQRLHRPQIWVPNTHMDAATSHSNKLSSWIKSRVLFKKKIHNTKVTNPLIQNLNHEFQNWRPGTAMSACYYRCSCTHELHNMEIIKLSLAENKCGLWGCTWEQSDHAQKSSPVSTMGGMSKGNPTTVDQKSISICSNEVV